eukprot:CAMPEP_0197623200 /NCGR_PEP_ID=MMETSP1338-20131121/3252_1 /TAXON_ID=43686 ORGANISM="Pelagodinium beii, Strain RCC1491" /NCGR_SAMPLE_ID=MMETSP1338 /ASSEMBLY_ACC=CAM_ASM_000754 /LENGTH=657 /DNA_ID=CAMNT_0043193095 /DNA_START=6 /DNA_END=1979 /DNA_ORIENTATION=-
MEPQPESSDAAKLIVRHDAECGETVTEDEAVQRVPRRTPAIAGALLTAVGCVAVVMASSRYHEAKVSPKAGFSGLFDLTGMAATRDLFDLTGMATPKCYRNKSFWVEQSGALQMPGTTRSIEVNAYMCQQRCAETEGCEHFSYWKDGGCLLSSYAAYSNLFEGSTASNGVISGPKVCKTMMDQPMEVLVSALDVPSFIAEEAPGCNSLHDEYQLAWKAQGETFFDDWQFINKSETRGAEWYLNRSEAFYQGTATASKEGAIIRVGEQVQPFKRRSMMLHSAEAWRPDVGFVVVMKYKHVPYGPGVWPAFWLLNSDMKWPQGGELDIMEYANYDTAKMTFHTDKNCSMNTAKLKQCAKTMTDIDPTMIASCYTNYSGNQLGCMPPQVRKDGEWFSKNPGAIALLWDASGITSFHIPEKEIPVDLESDTPKPNTWKDSWRMAFMPFEEKSCLNIARPQEIVLNIALCGDWAGNTFYACTQCRETGYTPNYCIPGHVTEPATDCCTLYISNPSAEQPLKDDAYFDISYVKVFTPKGKVLPRYSSGTYRNNGVHVSNQQTPATAPSQASDDSEALGAAPLPLPGIGSASDDAPLGATPDDLVPQAPQASSSGWYQDHAPVSQSQSTAAQHPPKHNSAMTPGLGCLQLALLLLSSILSRIDV